MDSVRRRNRIFYTALIGVFMVVVDTTAAFIAVPSMAADFGVPLPVAQWVVVGYLLTIAVCLVPFGRLSDSLGRKPMYVTGWVIIACGAAAVSQSPTALVLVLGRLTMGLGAALIQATSMPIVVDAFGGKDRGRVLGLQMGVVGLGTVLGPMFGGLMIGAFGWRGIYVVIGITSILLAIVSQRVLERRADAPQWRLSELDPKGMGLFVVFLLALLVTVTATGNLGLVSPWIGLGCFVALGAWLLFLRQERRTPAPMLDFNLFHVPAITMGLLSGVVVFMGTAGVFFLIPFYAQTVLGHTALVVGLILVPGGIVTAVGSPLIGLVADRFGHRRVSLLGQLILAAGTAGMATVQAGQSLAWLVAFLIMVSLGLASFHAPNSASVLGYVPSHRYGIVSGLINSARNIGNVLGIAAATGLVTWVMARNGYPPSLARVTADSDAALLQSFTEGMHLAFWVLCGLSLVVAALHGVFRTQRKGVSPSNP